MGNDAKTRPETIDHLTGQMIAGGLDESAVRTRPMFGEYGVYFNGQFVGVVCRDRLYLKPTDAADALEPGLDREPPYKGARPSTLVTEEIVDDPERLAALVRTTAEALPPSKSRTGR